MSSPAQTNSALLFLRQQKPYAYVSDIFVHTKNIHKQKKASRTVFCAVVRMFDQKGKQPPVFQQLQ